MSRLLPIALVAAAGLTAASWPQDPSEGALLPGIVEGPVARPSACVADGPVACTAADTMANTAACTAACTAADTVADAGRGLDAWAGGRVVTSCKPQAPIAVSLRQVSGGAAGAIELAFDVSPLRDFQDVTWELRLPNDVVLLSGTASGEAQAARAMTTAGSARVDLPADAAYRSLKLAARGSFVLRDDAGEPLLDEEGEPLLETVVAVAAMDWGEPRPSEPIVSRIDARGQVEQAVMLPSVQREGR